MRRRDVLRLLSVGVASLLASCTEPAPLPPAPTPEPSATPPPPPPTPAPASPTPVPATATLIPPAPTATPQPLPTATPTIRTPPALGAAVDAAFERGINQGFYPGGVALVRWRNETILWRAYGLSRKYRSPSALAPDPIDARPDTLYDLASLTKLFTLTAVLRLSDAGRLGIDEPVARYLPVFAANDKADVRVRHLLTHTSGLPDYVKLWELESTPAARVRRVLETPLVAPSDTLMRYSDLGLITVGKVVEQVTGTSLDRAIGELVTGPLGLRSTRFVPPPELKPRVAPTEDESNVGRGMVWGEVHDENAWSLGGVAGHAGIFGPADELAVLAQMYLDGGTFRGERFVQEDTVSEATRNQIGRLGERGLGWELDETYYMGRLAAPNVYGHTGFTGTSVVIDPDRELIVIVLTNRVHPTRNGPNMNPTRQAVANAALAVTSGSSSAPSRSVAPGVEVLLADRSDLLKGRRIGLVTNHTGLDVAGHSTIDRLYGQPDWRLTALFSPEHGIRGEVAAGENVGTSVDPQTGLPVFSLYGQTTRPTAAMLGNVDTLVFDLQDVGARTYTYISTLLEVLRAAAEHHVPVIVLDRPNPINGVDIDGPVLDPRFTSFVGAGPIAMRYGLTIGELGRLFNVELRVGADLIVVPVDRWRRTDWYDQTGLAWVNPSPNIRSLGAALVYPGTVLFEATTVSEGRGTEQPFEWIGAPWIDGAAWAERLNRFELPGVRFHARAATPTESKFAGQLCHGVLIEVVDRRVVRPVQIGVAMLLTADQLHYTDAFDRLAGTDQLRHALTSGASLVDITAGWQADLQRFNGVRQRYLLY